jgi:DNA-binding transcriptional LysR family regulator
MLTQDMQNRRIINAALAKAGVRVGARIETDSISALLSFARAGWSSVVSDAWLTFFGVPEGMRALRLVEPEVVQPVGIVTRESPLLSPLLEALLSSSAR